MADMFGNICTCRKCNGIVHTIKRGDTLYQLSRYYNVTINEIMRANANINVYNMQVGDQICIPVKRPVPMPMPGPGPVRPPMPGMNQPPMPGQMPGQGPNQGRPSLIQPRNNDMDENDDSNQEYIETSADTMFEETDTEAVCCGSGMKVKDLLKSDDMTLEELAEMMKNI